jgi:hypothetical protein
MPIRTVQEHIPQYQGALPAYEFKGMATGGLPLGGSEQPAGDARPFQHLGLLKTLFTADLLRRVCALRHPPWGLRIDIHRCRRQKRASRGRRAEGAG